MAMTSEPRIGKGPLVLMVAGAKGAVASTIAVAVAALQKNPHTILPWLTTADWVLGLGAFPEVEFAGWDCSARTLEESIVYHGVLAEGLWKSYDENLAGVELRRAPSPGEPLRRQIEQLTADIQEFIGSWKHCEPVLINLLPACASIDLSRCQSQEDLDAGVDPTAFPDMAYVIAAVRCGIPVVNFTPNRVEWPPIVEEAVRRGVPLAGRDGKTGQTYLKVVIASALKARRLQVDGWYSVNILGNEDGRNLDDPGRAAAKLANKTELLDDLLGYKVGAHYGTSSHKVRIDYYPPRGDAKEAWDVIDFNGLFGLPMSLRLNLQARDSILAAPLIIDLALWVAALQKAGKAGLISELAFYFKRPMGLNPPLTFQEQLAKLEELERICRKASR